MTTPDYPEKLCAFVDILGFRNIVAGIGGDRPKLATLINALQRVHKPLIPGLSDLRDVAYRTQSISDAVAISVIPTIEGLANLTSVLQTLTMSLLAEGYFIRGAIARGRLHHEDEIVLGDALVKAYDYESKIARYPRIMVPTDVAALANGPGKLAGASRQRFHQADDGPLYIHVLQGMQDEMNRSPLGPDNDEDTAFGEYATIKRLIEERYKEAMDNPAHFEKVQWFARYWNKSLPANATSFRILGVGL